MTGAAASFVTGVVLLQFCSVLPDFKEICFSVMLIGIFALLHYWRLMLLSLGFVFASVMAIDRMADRLPVELEGIEQEITGEIIGLPSNNGQRVRADFKVISATTAIPQRLRLSWYYPQQPVLAGQTWKLTVKLKRPHSMLNPGGFDYERWLLMHGINATGYVRNKPEPVLIAQQTRWQNISVWRQSIAQQLSRLSDKHKNISIIKALSIGDRQDLSVSQWDIFRRTGTIHLMAISGLHIGLVSGLVYFVVLRLWAFTGILKFSPPQIAAVSALAAGACYAALAGFSIPTQRTLIMLTMVMSAIILQRHTRASNTLALALIVVVILDPWSVLSSGFWLSFLAVAVIVFSLAGRLKKPNYWIASIKIHWVTAVGLSPFLLLFFQQVSLVAPLANLIAVPVISIFVVPTALLSMLLLTIFPSLASGLLLIIGDVLQWLQDFLQLLAHSSYAHWEAPEPEFWSLFFALPGVLLLLSPKGVPGRFLGVLLFLPMLFFKPDRLDPGAVSLTLLDVGQGLAAVIQTEHHLLLYDTGAKYSDRFDLGRSVIIPFLKSQGVKQVDMLVISHGDNDHIGGANTVLQEIKVAKILTSVPKQMETFSAHACASGQSWVWDKVIFEILSPKTPGFSSDNDNSCVLQIKSAHGTILLTGDIETPAENWLLARYGKALAADVLVVPHHGSDTSSSEQFINQVNAKLALIPAGYRNRFGFPHKQVVERYQQKQIRLFNVSDHGAIKVTLANGSKIIATQRGKHMKYWNKKQ